MVHELLGIKNHRVDLSSAPGINKELHVSNSIGILLNDSFIYFVRKLFCLLKMMNFLERYLFNIDNYFKNSNVNGCHCIVVYGMTIHYMLLMLWSIIRICT